MAQIPLYLMSAAGLADGRWRQRRGIVRQVRNFFSPLDRTPADDYLSRSAQTRREGHRLTKLLVASVGKGVAQVFRLGRNL